MSSKISLEFEVVIRGSISFFFNSFFRFMITHCDLIKLKLLSFSEFSATY